MPHLSTRVLSAGVDTLTCSVPWEGGINSFMDLARGLQLEEEKQGSKITYFKRGGYKGQQSRHVGLAWAPGRILAELRGNWAHIYWPHFLERAEKVSRLDIEVSVRQEPYDHEMAIRLWHLGRDEAEQQGRPSSYRLQAEADGGTTLYIGKGSSRYQARLYERYFKTHHKEDRNVWRYEVQCRRERAQQMADLCIRSADVQPFIQAAVHGHFKRRGVVPIYDPQTDVRVAPLPEEETSREKSLNWLSTSVAPALSRHERWGSYDQAIRALGIA